MHISIEIPVYKLTYLRAALKSVLSQNYHDWSIYMLWDKELLGEVPRDPEYKDSRVTYVYSTNEGIASSRKKLSDVAESDLIFPLDDDDLLAYDALKKTVCCAKKLSDFGLIRGRRQFIDTAENWLNESCWFPFEKRTFHKGMTMDIYNHAQPYIINRKAYEKTTGWEGFSKFKGAGEDCDMFLKIEEVGEVHLLDELLYLYRIHGDRYSLELKREGAFEIWTELAKKTIERRGLDITLDNSNFPFLFKEFAHDG